MTQEEVKLHLKGESEYGVKQLLESHCDAIEERPYFRKFEPEERVEVSEEFISKSVELERVDAEFDDVKARFKEKLKPLKEVTSKLRTELKNNGREEYGNIYMIADHENGLMNSYTQQGILVNSRKLKATEKQFTIKPLAKAN